MEALLHIAEQRAAILICDIRRRHAFDQHAARLRRVKPQQQLKHRAFACACTPGKRYLLTRLYLQADVLQHRVVVIAKGDVAQFHLRLSSGQIGRQRDGLAGGRLALRQEFIDAAYASDGGLDGLNFHAQAFHGGENLGDIVDYRHRRASRHAKQRQHPGVAGGG